jgi:hypothetical protein
MKYSRAVVLLALVLMASQYALADPVAATDLSVISSGSRTLSGSSNGTVSAQGGNVTELNIDALTITKVWQGYYGNVTGNIHLDDASNNSFYIWGNATQLTGEVYATRNASPIWSSVNCSNSTQRGLEETYLGVAPTDGDSVLNTFNRTSHPSFYIGLRQITANSCYSTYGFVNGTAQNSTFSMVLLADSNNNSIYTTMLVNDQYGYNGRRMDFQLLVGENEHIGSLGPTPYYFFVELS